MILILSSFLEEKQRDFLEKLYKEIGPKMYYISLSILRDSYDAEDALTNTFVKISKYIEKISSLPSHEIQAYCIVILKNESYRIYDERAKTIAVDHIDQHIETSPELYPEQASLKVMDRDMINNYISELSAEEERLLYYRYMENMTFRKIGKILNITEIAARKRHQRILEKLRRRLEEDGNGHI